MKQEFWDNVRYHMVKQGIGQVDMASRVEVRIGRNFKQANLNFYMLGKAKKGIPNDVIEAIAGVLDVDIEQLLGLDTILINKYTNDEKIFMASDKGAALIKELIAREKGAN